MRRAVDVRRKAAAERNQRHRHRPVALPVGEPGEGGPPVGRGGLRVLEVGVGLDNGELERSFIGLHRRAK